MAKERTDETLVLDNMPNIYMHKQLYYALCTASMYL